MLRINSACRPHPRGRFTLLRVQASGEACRPLSPPLLKASNPKGFCGGKAIPKSKEVCYPTNLILGDSLGSLGLFWVSSWVWMISSRGSSSCWAHLR